MSDRIVSRPSTDEYRKNWERAFVTAESATGKNTVSVRLDDGTVPEGAIEIQATATFTDTQ